MFLPSSCFQSHLALGSPFYFGARWYKWIEEKYGTGNWLRIFRYLHSLDGCFWNKMQARLESDNIGISPGDGELCLQSHCLWPGIVLFSIPPYFPSPQQSIHSHCLAGSLRCCFIVEWRRGLGSLLRPKSIHSTASVGLLGAGSFRVGGGRVRLRVPR